MRYEPRADNIAVTVIDGEAIIVNLTTGVYYSMAGVGAEVWELVSRGLTAPAIAETLAARHEVEREAALEDTEQLIEKLLAEDLIASSQAEPQPAIEAVQESARTEYATPVLEIYRDMGDLLALDPPMPGLRDFAPLPQQQK